MTTARLAQPSMSGAIYCRISKDTEGLALGVERQREDCVALAESLGIEVKPEHILIENDVGASSKSRGRRPQYEKLKEMVETREVQAVIFYSNSRLTRRHEEFNDWIKLHEKTGVRLFSKVSGDDDLGTADGRMVARIKASVDAAEAERISERVKRALEQRRASGLLATGGPRPFGFTDSGGSPRLVPEEADAIRYGAKMLLAGATHGAVAQEWTSRGLKPVRAKGWTRESVRGIYQSARLAGLVAHNGEIVGGGNFPAIIDRQTWESIQGAVRHGPSRPAGYGARVHPLAGFVFCGSCGATMVVSGAEGNPEAAYKCVKNRQGCGRMKRNKRWLDMAVDAWVRGKLSNADAVEVESGDHGHADEIRDLEERIAEVRQQHIDGHLDGADFFPLLSCLRGKLNALQKAETERERRATQEAALHDPMRAWEGGSLAVRRALLASLVQGVYVKPVGRIGRRPIPHDSIEIVEA